MRKRIVGFLATVAVMGGAAAKGAIIASDSFESTATVTANTYQSNASLNGQTATVGTTGYFTGTAAGSQIAGWQSGTGAFTVSATALTHPLTANAPSGAPDGSVLAGGNSNNRLQYRDFMNTTPPASTTYYYSNLLRESSNSYTGTTFAGVGPSQASGNNAVVPTTGFDLGFVNGAITLFYNNGGTNFQTATDQKTLVAATSTSANSTYLAEVAITVVGTTATLTPSVYNSAGTLVNVPASQVVTETLNAADMGAFQTYITSDFTGTGPATVNFDEFRFGTAPSDVVAAPEPASLSLLGLVGFALLSRRRTSNAKRTPTVPGDSEQTARAIQESARVSRPRFLD